MIYILGPRVNPVRIGSDAKSLYRITTVAACPLAVRCWVGGWVHVLLVTWPDKVSRTTYFDYEV